MAKLGPYSKQANLGNLDGRTREARLVKSLRLELTAQIGGSPTTTQQVLISQAALLQLRIALMDRDSPKIGELTERNQVQYLAWTNSLSRCLRDLGMEPPVAVAAVSPSAHKEWLASLSTTTE